MEDKVTIVSNHHRRSLFFESTMQRLSDAGFKKIVIQNTGAGPMGNYQGPSSKIINLGQSTYDNGMIKLKQTLSNDDSEYIVLIDNDCFLSDTNHFKEYLNDFEKGNYDFACHFIGAHLYTDDYVFKGSLAPVTDQKILPADVFPWIVPDPHWENAYLIIRRSMWDKLSVDDVSHGRKYIAALVRENAKLAVHKALYVGTHSHYGDEWFHVGALMRHYHLIESKKLGQVSVESPFDKARLGYFIFQEEIYGDIYPGNIKQNLEAFYTKLGGKDSCLTAWKELIKGTCMEGWQK
jgi:hypothetical protein